jgi:3-oxoacyl-[acyl-carrier protein] reductase
VVNISSGVTGTALAGIGLYSAVKAFLDQVTKVAAVEFAARRLTVNAVAPGSTATGPFASLTAAQRAEAGASAALGPGFGGLDGLGTELYPFTSIIE